jgi:hypothetical protein
VGSVKGKGPLMRSRAREDDNIKIDFQEIDWRVLTGFIWPRIGFG